MSSFNVSRLQMAGKFTLAQRLRAAEDESRELARLTLMHAGKALARRDRAGFVSACVEAAAHYRNAGDATLAAHWQNRANMLRAEG